MSELDKLEYYLKRNSIAYQRIDTDDGYGIHQIVVPCHDSAIRQWDAICHPGSLGYSDGLLEIMGSIVRSCEDDVEGYLTAQDVIERIESTSNLSSPKV